MKIRRVVVRLDPAPRSRAVLDAAAELAQTLEAELVGLFVENVNLLHFAGLPFAHEIGFPSATRRSLDVAAMERALRLRARQARELVALAGQASPVPWSFHVAHATDLAQVSANVLEADLVVAQIGHMEELMRSPSVRIVRAGAVNELRLALQGEGGGILVLAGSNDQLVGETLRQLREGIRS